MRTVPECVFPLLDCTRDELVAYCWSLNPDDKVIEHGQSGMHHQTGVVVEDPINGDVRIRWDTNFEGTEGKMVTSFTHGARLITSTPEHWLKYKNFRLAQHAGWQRYHCDLWVPPGLTDFSELDCQELPLFYNDKKSLDEILKAQPVHVSRLWRSLRQHPSLFQLPEERVRFEALGMALYLWTDEYPQLTTQ
jgi:hypothetical protein